MVTPGETSPRHLIRKGTVHLGGRPASERICETLLSELLGVGRTALYLEEKDLSEARAHHFFQLLEGVRKGQPLQYLLGRAVFMGDSFKVTPACFIPRLETEILVETCLDYFQGETKPLLFMDVGTGCGCIAISLTKKMPCSKMIAIDLMEDALKVARWNGQHHKVSESIFWICGNLFSPLRRDVAVDAILSNPPYIPSEEMDGLPPEVRREPKVSLEAGTSGLRYYRQLASEAPPFLKEEGLLFLEIGDRQETWIAEIFSKRSLRLLEIRRDVSGTPRIMIFRRSRRYG